MKQKLKQEKKNYPVSTQKRRMKPGFHSPNPIISKNRSDLLLFLLTFFSFELILQL